ncbi:hypothetical protein BH09PLA1_BH09PLA1_14320 [soil metagenome]
MNEWDLQRILTKQWTECGLQFDGMRHMLIAWEIMFPSWKVNDIERHWNEPSCDFIVADRSGRLTVIELKVMMGGIKPAWQALCQVTHRANEMAHHFKPERLNKAHRDCYSGYHIGRKVDVAKRSSLVEHHRRFFELDEHADFDAASVGRCVAAVEYGDAWQGVLKDFNRLSRHILVRRVDEELSSKASQVERRRFLEMLPHDALDRPVLSLRLT